MYIFVTSNTLCSVTRDAIKWKERMKKNCFYCKIKIILHNSYPSNFSFTRGRNKSHAISVRLRIRASSRYARRTRRECRRGVRSCVRIWSRKVEWRGPQSPAAQILIEVSPWRKIPPNENKMSAMSQKMARNTTTVNRDFHIALLELQLDIGRNLPIIQLIDHSRSRISLFFFSQIVRAIIRLSAYTGDTQFFRCIY